jgi:hypothetical protein
MPHAFLCKKKFRTKRLFAAKNEKAAWDQIPAAFRLSGISLATNQSAKHAKKANETRV